MYKDLDDFMNPNPESKQKKHKSKRKQKSHLMYALPIIVFAVLLINSMTSAELHNAINRGEIVANRENDIVELGYVVSRNNLSKRETKDFIRDNYDSYLYSYTVMKVIGEVDYKENASSRANNYILNGYNLGNVKGMLSKNGFTDEEVDYAMEHVSEP